MGKNYISDVFGELLDYKNTKKSGFESPSHCNLESSWFGYGSVRVRWFQLRFGFGSVEPRK